MRKSRLFCSESAIRRLSRGSAKNCCHSMSAAAAPPGTPAGAPAGVDSGAYAGATGTGGRS